MDIQMPQSTSQMMLRMNLIAPPSRDRLARQTLAQVIKGCLTAPADNRRLAAGEPSGPAALAGLSWPNCAFAEAGGRQPQRPSRRHRCQSARGATQAQGTTHD